MFQSRKRVYATGGTAKKQYVQKTLMSGTAYQPRFGQARLSINELKDNTVRSTAVVTGAGAVTGSTPLLLNGLTQGTSAVTRIGRRITVKSLLVRWYVQLAATTTGGAPLRLLVVADRQTNGAAPAITDILLTDEIASPMNLNNSKRFKVVCDEIIPVIGAGGPQSIMIQRYMKLNMNTEFNSGNAGTVADITTGSLYVMAWQGGGLATAAPTSVFYSRVRFSDS